MKAFSIKVVITLLIILAFIVVPVALYLVLPHFIPFLLAFLVALILEPVFNWFTRRLKLSRPLSILLTYFIFIASLGFLLFILSAKIYSQSVEWLTYLQNNTAVIHDWALHVIHQLREGINMLPAEVSRQITDSLTTFAGFITSPDTIGRIGGWTLSITAAVPNFFILTLIFLVALYLFCLQLDAVRLSFFSLFKPSTAQKLKVFLGDLKKSLAGFLIAHIILGTITFLMAFIGLLILNVRYAALYALIATIVDLLPIVGIGTFLIPWAVVSLITGKVFLGVGLIILFIIILTVRKAIEPKVLGQRIGLGALPTLISLWVGFKLFGIVGIFLAPFLLIVIKAIFHSRLIDFNYKL